MAIKRFRNGKYQFVVKNKKLLPNPLYLTFENEADGDAYVEDLEKYLSNGIVPREFQNDQHTIKLHELINEYMRTVSMTDEKRQLSVQVQTQFTTDSFGNATCRSADGVVLRGSTNSFGNETCRDNHGNTYRGRTDSFGSKTYRACNTRTDF